MRLGLPKGRASRVLLIVLGFVGMTALFYYEVAFLGRSFQAGTAIVGVMGYDHPWAFRGDAPEDTARPDRGASAWVHETQARAVGRAWAKGAPPLWTPNQGLGAPLAANASSGAFDVWRIPVFVSRAPLAWDSYYLGRTVLILVLTWAYAGSVGLVRGARLLAAIAFAFSGFLVLYGNNAFVEVYVFLPGLLWGIELLMADKRAAGLVVTTLATASATLVGMPEATLMVLLYGGGYALCRLVGRAREQRSWRVLIGAPPRTLVLSWVLGLGLAAPLVLPLAEYIANAHHIHGPERALGLEHLPVWDAIRLAFPFVDDERAGLAVIQLGYSGAAVAALAVLGAVSARRSTPAMAHLIMVALFLAKFFGFPVVNELGRLPGLISTIIPKWGASCLAFGLAMLAASAADAAARRLLRSRVVLIGSGCFLAIQVVLILGNVGVLTDGPTLGRTLLVLGTGTCVALSALFIARGRLRRVGPASALALLVFVELFALAPHGIYATRSDPLTEPPFIRFLVARREMLGPQRLLGLGGVLYPNTATAYGLEDLRSLDALYPSRYFEFLRRFICPNVYDRYTGELGGEGRTRLGANPWLNAAGVRFVILPRATGPDGRLFGLGAHPDQFSSVYQGEVDIYENLRALPRAWLTARVRVVLDRKAAAEVAEARDFDPSLGAVIEPVDPFPDLPGADGPPRPLAGSVDILDYEPERVHLVTRARCPALLVLADQYFPGWEATVDGVSSTIYPTNITFRGVVVPAGVHRVEFRYRPSSFRRGVWLAASASLVLAGAVLLLKRRDHSSPPAASV